MEIISPKLDFCAKELFANPIIRKYFISDVTGIKVEDIKSIRLCNPYLWKRYRRQKQGILDMLVELNNDTKVNIELQVKFYMYWEKRSLFYLSKMYTEDLRTGENYAKLKKSISISILDYNLTNDPKYHSTYYLRDENGRIFTDLFEVHIIELGKTLNGNSTVDDWIRFFNARSEEELDMIHTQNIGINTAIEEVKKMSLSEHMRTRYEAHMKEIRDRNAREDYVRQQGIECGRQEGIQEGRQEGRIMQLIDLVKEGILDESVAQQKSGLSEEEFKKYFSQKD